MQTASKIARGSILAIDPGKHGGIALIRPDKPFEVFAWRFPVTPGGYDWPSVAGIMDGFRPDVVVVEVTKNVRIGGRSNPAAVASLAACVEGSRALAMLRGIKFIGVASRTWQSVIHSGDQDDTKAASKAALDAYHVEIVGWNNKDTRDAVCIGLWAMLEMGVKL